MTMNQGGHFYPPFYFYSPKGYEHKTGYLIGGTCAECNFKWFIHPLSAKQEWIKLDSLIQQHKNEHYSPEHPEIDSSRVKKDLAVKAPISDHKNVLNPTACEQLSQFLSLFPLIPSPKLPLTKPNLNPKPIPSFHSRWGKSYVVGS